MVTRFMKPIGSRMPLMNPGAYTNLPLTRSYRALTSPPRAMGGVHYRTSQWLYAVYGLETTQI